MRSNPVHQFFIFQLKNILRSYLDFSTSYGRLTDLKSFQDLLLVSFIWLGEKFHLNIYLSAEGRLSPYAQTVSTSFMPRLVNPQAVGMAVARP